MYKNVLQSVGLLFVHRFSKVKTTQGVKSTIYLTNLYVTLTVRILRHLVFSTQAVSGELSKFSF